MIEVLVALGAAVIIISSITVAVITSVNNTSYSANQNRAAQLAQEGLDVARQVRDSDYEKFTSYENTTQCLGENKEFAPGCSNIIIPNVAQYIRTVRFSKNVEKCGEDVTEVESDVSWSDSKCPASDTFCHSVKLVSCFSQFGVIPTP